MKIGILLIATGKYIKFYKPLADSIFKYFLPGHEKHIYLFTDSGDYPNDDKTTIIPIERKGFPGDTLFRYHYFLRQRELLKTNDYLWYMDVDSSVVRTIGDEILPFNEENIVLCQHPGFFNTLNERGTPETRPQSSAYISPNTPLKYCCGGLVGGRVHSFIAMAQQIAGCIDTDASKGIVAIWHDESYINHWNTENQHQIKIIPPHYMYPENCGWKNMVSMTPYILALQKNHAEVRQE